MFLITTLFGAISLLYIWLKWNYSFWKRHKVAGPEPTLFVGNIGPTLNFTEHWGIIAQNWYNEYPNEPYVGYYKLMKPAIMVRDPDFIKDILITNFNCFRDNDVHLSKKYDPLTATNPFFVRDDEWRESRKTILPAFSKLKIKSITPVMNGVGADLMEYIKSFPSNTDFNAKDISIRFTTENVIKCTFSIEPGCFNKQYESEFLEAGKTLFAPSLLVGIKVLALLFLPEWVIDNIPIPFVPASIDKIFRSLVHINKESRSKDFQSHDILQMLLQIQAKHNFDDTFLAGHALSLFIDGTETSSTALSYALYELAKNPNCQEKLYNQMLEAKSKHDGQLTAECILEIEYLEGILLEALRKHPPLLVMSKTCTEQYTIPKTTEQSKPMTIYPGTVVNIPVLAIHMDPKYYPNPDEFKPERFTEEEQRNRHKGIFLGFGEGPRICLGMRFAIAQVMVALAYIVENFHIKLSQKQKPIVFDPQSLLSYPKDGILIQFETRK